MRSTLHRSITVIPVFAVTALLGHVAAAAPGDFVEDDVRVLWQASGQAGAFFGWAVAELADVDGDGAGEAVIGAPQHDAGDGAGGLLVVHSGRTGQELFRLQGQVGERVGYAMADAQDVDGDGTHDVVVGAVGSNGTGRAYVLSGSDGTIALTLEGEAAGDAFGSAVASAGDVNADGHADLLIGAENHAGVGRVYVMSGADGSTIRSFDGSGMMARFGSATAFVGDIDGDDIPDAFVGARDAGDGQRGRAYLYAGDDGELIHELDGGSVSADFGWFFVATVGDVDGDSTPDLYVGDFSASTDVGPVSGRVYVFSGSDGSLLWHVDGEAPGVGMGPGRGAGDVDDDGVPDVAAGSYVSGAGATQAGRISILSGVDGSILRTITSEEPMEQFGFDAVNVGDVDGDGAVDLLASAANGSNVYLIAGLADEDDTDTAGEGTDDGAGESGSDDDGEDDEGEDDDGEDDEGGADGGDTGPEGCHCHGDRCADGGSLLLLSGLLAGVARRRRRR